jgi:hypothetical protein
MLAQGLAMRALVILFLIACNGSMASPKPSLEGDITCGSHTCHSGQICVTETAGHTCWTNDAGVGEYGIHDQFCADVPPACDGVPSCDCITCEGLCFGVADRSMGCGCF